MTLAHPQTQPLQVFQWLGDNLSTAPLWVRMTCRQNGDEIIHERRSGRQVVYSGEYLVRNLDGGVNFYTAPEYLRHFR